ncbi:Type IV secretory pathway VirB3 family protein [uncultured Desulfobacterium sp.]|uniref:Type IV secretory pathway VirB3 family protein n=1 Tax=uncultured Desulfobacterium sp. TaxID=201089 RepID=A0A445MSN1_9BACT|nr:Type IV secretory pathway VirB3 family protein [uncultured Desulfobacterium sp.]
MTGREQEIPGFHVPYHRSLMQVVLIAGLPRSAAYMLWTIAAALGMGMRQWWVLPVAIVIHALVAIFIKNDPYFFEILNRALKAPKSLEP